MSVSGDVINCRDSIRISKYNLYNERVSLTQMFGVKFRSKSIFFRLSLGFEIFSSMYCRNNYKDSYGMSSI